MRERVRASAAAEAAVWAPSTTSQGRWERNSILAGTETPHAGESQGGVSRLVGAGHGELGLEDERALPKADALIVEILLQDLRAEVAPVSSQGTAELAGALFHHRGRLGRQSPHDEGNAGLGDAGLLAGDRRQAGAQLLGVFEFDARHTGHRGSHDVRRVQAPAQAHLQHHVIDPGVCEQSERRRGGGVEEAGGVFGPLISERVDLGPQSLHHLGQLLPRHLLSVDPKPLGPRLQVR
jgi:hypothetical protein